MKKKFLVAGIFTGLFACLAIMLKTINVNVDPITGSEIGLADINRGVFDKFGASKTWDTVSDVLIAISIVVAVVFVTIGVMQLVKRKKLNKVDRELYTLAGLYGLTALLYVVFEKIIVINYRPILVEGGKMEASFPSTHTMVSCVILWSATILISKYIKNVKLSRALQVICVLMPIMIGVGRILAGMHWFTDVLGAMLLSAALVCVFWGVTELVKKK